MGARNFGGLFTSTRVQTPMRVLSMKWMVFPRCRAWFWEDLIEWSLYAAWKNAVAKSSKSTLKNILVSFSAMDPVDEAYRNRISTVLRALYATKYAKEDNVPCQIEQGLFLGSIGVAFNKVELKRLNITHVLIVAKSLEPAFPNGFVYKKIEVLDSPDTNLEQHFDECFNFIDEAKRMGGGVLVHCFAGKSRSVTIIVAYLMKKHHMRLSEAIDLVRSKRPQVAPNYGFMLQLQNFEKSLRAQD